jgi:DNA polymerase I-like protein with 3'-5' exonuclease and polymerase domains
MYFMQEQVFQYHKKLLLMHPLERWWDQTTRALAAQNNILYNCFGYRRTFHDPDEHNRLKDGLSFLPQSTVAWLMNQALPPVHQWVTQQGGYIQLLLQIHDEFLFQATPDAIEALVQKVTPLLEVTFTVHGHPLHIPVEWKRGRSWGSMQKFNHKEMV